MTIDILKREVHVSIYWGDPEGGVFHGFVQRVDKHGFYLVTGEKKDRYYYFTWSTPMVIQIMS